MIKVRTPEIQTFEKEHVNKLRSIAPECMVLLKKNGDFPLASPCKIALYGSGARETIKGGSGSGDVYVRHFTSVEEGLINAGFTVTTGSWMDGYRAAKDAARAGFFEGIIAQAKQEGKPAFLVGMGKTPPEPDYMGQLDGSGDVCVYVLARDSGEGSDRAMVEGDFLLTETETQDILLCVEKYRKFMLVLNVGGPIDISPVMDRVENILLLSQLGTVTGDAFADVLLGKVSPSGRLTSTWAKAEDYASIGDFAQQDDTRYREGIYVGYRYFDAAGIKPLFPFGYGLSYSEFRTTVSSFAVEDKAVVVSVNVKNTGTFTGKETVLLYYSAPQGRLGKPLRELGAYAKTRELCPGMDELVTLTLPLENMASWDSSESAWVLEGGEYIISVDEDPIGVVALDRNTVVSALAPVGGEADFEDWTSMVRPSVPEGLCRIAVSSETLVGIGHYDRGRAGRTRLFKPDMSSFSDEELASLCVGKYGEGPGIASVIGNSSFSVAGAAAETADLLYEKGFGRLVMADGPAGLRLATRYVEREEGAESVDNSTFEYLIDLFDDPLRSLMKEKFNAAKEAAKTMPVFYQYASAIPIGTALAQSWNLEAVKTCGDIVGAEMALFGVNVWLAPALNIHRSPLCGRNFEYYSEDSLVSGRTAAAMVQSVQQHKNCAVTIKHFCCNNQETNRFGSNSIVSQRALREIYLKAFEICVKESSPKAVMTSYNLLNGVHTANRKDILTEILRAEWDFEGVVMTDWSTTSDRLNRGKHGASRAALCVKAGNDLTMPGTRADVEDILSAIHSGELERSELEECAGRILSLSSMLSV